MRDGGRCGPAGTQGELGKFAARFRTGHGRVERNFPKVNWTLLQNSLLVSALTTGLSVVFGLVAGLWLAGLETRWRTRWLIVAVVALCLPPFLVTNCWL